MIEFKEKDPLFVGLTRPALMWGIPYIYFMFMLPVVALSWVLFKTLLASAVLGATMYVVGLYLGRSDPFLSQIWSVRFTKGLQRNKNFRFWRAQSYRP